jgi:c-di-AMP phosphodiesterase-like protein
MNKKKMRQRLTYVLLGFVLFLYVFSIGVFIFGEPKAAIAVFAYNTFFTVVVYFLALYQKRLNALMMEASMNILLIHRHIRINL